MPHILDADKDSERLRVIICMLIKLTFTFFFFHRGLPFCYRGHPLEHEQVGQQRTSIRFRLHVPRPHGLHPNMYNNQYTAIWEENLVARLIFLCTTPLCIGYCAC